MFFLKTFLYAFLLPFIAAPPSYCAFFQQSAVLQSNSFQFFLKFVDLHLRVYHLHLPEVLRAVQALHHFTHKHTDKNHIKIVSHMFFYAEKKGTILQLPTFLKEAF